MRRHALWLAVAAALSLPIAACHSDNTTGIPAISAKVEGSNRPLRDDIAFFTYQFDPAGNLAVMNSDGSGRRPLTGGELGFEPAISPDGRRIAFSRVTDLGVSAIYVMNIDGTNATPIVQGLVFNPGPTWSPDGTRLAFTRNAALQVINVDGTGMTVLPNEDMAQSASWSPDGQRIAYMSVDPVGEVHVRNADGSNLVRVTTTPEFFDGWPRWSPDGRELVFSRFADGQAQIVTINADGTGAVRLTPQGINDYMPDWSHSHPSARCNADID